MGLLGESPAWGHADNCAGLDWGGGNFGLTGKSWSILLIYTDNSVANTGMCFLELSSEYTEPRPFLLVTLPHQQVAWWCTSS